MSTLEEIFESVNDDEILVLDKESVSNLVNFLTGSNTPSYKIQYIKTADGTIQYTKLPLIDFTEKKHLNTHLNYLKIADIKAQESFCKKKQVGTVIVKNGIISEGYNGSFEFMEETCEGCDGDTFWHIVHAEADAILKLAASNISSEGATLYNTLCPCKDCSKLILGAKISKVFISNTYKTLDGVKLLLKGGIGFYYVNQKQLS